VLLTDFQRFYNSEETSDLLLKLGPFGDPARHIHAHKVILATASGHFKKVLHYSSQIVSNRATTPAENLSNVC